MLNFAKFPVNFPVSREFDGGDGFESDCIHHHPTPGFSTQFPIEAAALQAARLDPEAYRKQTAETRQALNVMPGECGLASSIAFQGDSRRSSDLP
jgi:hypothetical protein